VYRLKYLDSALDDIAHITRYIAERSANREVATAYRDKLMAKCQSLADSEFQLGTLRRNLGFDIRSMVEGNYLIFFRYIDDVVEIVHITEGHRNLKFLFDQ